MTSSVSTLNRLIETCRNGQAGFAKAASEVPDAHLRKVLGEYSEQRAQFAAQLSALVRQLGGEPAESGSVAGALHRGLMSAKTAVVGTDQSAVLEECARGEYIAISAYVEALREDMPAVARDTVEAQRLQIEEVRGRLAELLAHVQARRVPE